MSAPGISQRILEVIEPLGLDPSLCVRICLDGKSVMSGHRGRVQALQKETFSKAVYVHCNELCTAAKVSGYVTTFFDILNNPHNFFTGAQRHTRFIALQKEMHPNGQCMELERLCETRWSLVIRPLSLMLSWQMRPLV